MTDFIPVNEPLLDGNERAYVDECVSTGWISSEGPFVGRFEAAFAEAVGKREAVSVTNGTAALKLAVTALGLEPGDEVIVPTFTIISCVSAILRAGAVPVLVDCEPETWNMDVARIAARIGPRTRAIMAVHIYGLPVDLDPVVELCRRHGLRLIEDGAEAIGVDYKGRPCGGFGDISAFSFYANKQVTTGEGGMVATDDLALAERCRYLRNLAFSEPRFVHHDLGWNLRLTNLQAAVGLAQTESLPRHVAMKKAMGRRYDALLSDVAGIQRPPVRISYAENVFWVYGLVLDDDIDFDAAEAMRRLRDLGIGTRPFFWPMHEQPVLRERGLFAGERYPVAERIARRGFYLPSGTGLTVEQQDRVVDAVRTILR